VSEALATPLEVRAAPHRRRDRRRLLTLGAAPGADAAWGRIVFPEPLGSGARPRTLGVKCRVRKNARSTADGRGAATSGADPRAWPLGRGFGDARRVIAGARPQTSAQRGSRDNQRRPRWCVSRNRPRRRRPVRSAAFPPPADPPSDAAIGARPGHGDGRSLVRAARVAVAWLEVEHDPLAPRAPVLELVEQELDGGVGHRSDRRAAHDVHAAMRSRAALAAGLGAVAAALSAAARARRTRGCYARPLRPRPRRSSADSSGRCCRGSPATPGGSTPPTSTRRRTCRSRTSARARPAERTPRRRTSASICGQSSPLATCA
jgi:hypothetical protein